MVVAGGLLHLNQPVEEVFGIPAVEHVVLADIQQALRFLGEEQEREVPVAASDPHPTARALLLQSVDLVEAKLGDVLEQRGYAVERG